MLGALRVTSFYGKRKHSQATKPSKEVKSIVEKTPSVEEPDKASSRNKKDYITIEEKYFDEAKKALEEDRFKNFLALRNKWGNCI